RSPRLDGSGNPVWLLLELTYQCPLQCVFCSNPRNFADYRQDELSTAEWIDVMAQARAMGAMQIGFSGGEPTLRKDLETLVAEADRMGRSEEHTSELQSRENLVCRLLLEKKKKTKH